jgi:hypothetical protein
MNATDRDESGWEGAAPEVDPKVRRPAWKKDWTTVMGVRPRWIGKSVWFQISARENPPWIRDFSI